MSIVWNKIKLDRPDKLKKGKAIFLLLTLLESVFTLFLTISLAAHILFPEQTEAVAGVSKILSYQGRLTDSSGNPLGGSGTNYCFRFSIYDAANAGTKLWPSGTPSNNVVNVVNGIFNVGVGEADDLSTLDFSSNDTVYLQVEVANYSGSCGTYEALAPRQRIDATAYARVAAGVYGSALKTSSSNVQIGSGAGSATPIFLNLDVKNTSDTIGGSCSTNGALWYNSANSKALVCDNGAIRIVGSLGELAAIGVNASTPVSAGTVVFSNSNNVTFGLNGSTITASVNAGVSGIAVSNSTTYTSGTVVLAAGPNITLQTNGQTISISGAAGGGGGAAPNLSLWMKPDGLLRGGIGNITNITALSNRPFFVPIKLDGNITVESLGLQVSRATAGSDAFTVQYGVYTYINSTQIGALGTCQDVFSNTATASNSGIRALWLTCLGTHTNASTLSPGNYVLGFYFSAANTASMNYSLRGLSNASNWVLGDIIAGNDQYSTNVSQSVVPLFGRYSTTQDSPIATSYAQSQILAHETSAAIGASSPIDLALTIANF